MKKVDSSFKAMDRHADKSARDDNKKRILGKTSKATILHKQLGGRICDEKVGLCSGERGDKPRWLSHKRAEAIHDSSPKANAKRSKL